MATDGRQGARETAMNAAVAKATYDVAVRLLQPTGATVRWAISVVSALILQLVRKCVPH